MADRIEALYAEFGQELAAWGILLLTSRPQKGGIGRLVADVQACRARTTAMEMLETLATEADRRDAEERYE